MTQPTIEFVCGGICATCMLLAGATAFPYNKAEKILHYTALIVFGVTALILAAALIYKALCF